MLSGLTNFRKTIPTCKSLPNVLIYSSQQNESSNNQYSSKSTSRLHKIIFNQTYNNNKPISIINRINIETKKQTSPTIGELLGDNDLFYSNYYQNYRLSKLKRKRNNYHQTYSYPWFHMYNDVHNHWKYRQENSFCRNQQQKYQLTSSVNQIYHYPPTFSCYCCYSNMSFYQPYFTFDYYRNLH